MDKYEWSGMGVVRIGTLRQGEGRRISRSVG